MNILRVDIVGLERAMRTYCIQDAYKKARENNMRMRPYRLEYLAERDFAGKSIYFSHETKGWRWEDGIELQPHWWETWLELDLSWEVF